VLPLVPAAIPSPEVSSFSLGPLPLHIYAFCILAGIAVAALWANRRWTRRGGRSDDLFDIVFAAIILGIVGARVYHVVSSPDAYFGPGGNPWQAFNIRNGGLGIWGAIAGGAVGAWFVARRKRIPLADVADVLAPTLLVAQAIGRLGNWFNQELYGRPTDLPWGLEITCRMNGGTIPGCTPGTYHPTFLYEMVWNLAGAALLVWLERRFRLGGGRTFWTYVLLYVSGRLWIEMLRIDEAEMVLGLRINVWVSIGVLVLAVIMLVTLTRAGGTLRRITYDGRELTPAELAAGDRPAAPDAADPAETPTERRPDA
jgi:prolipoprotein diacylglyceryl transferase